MILTFILHTGHCSFFFKQGTLTILMCICGRRGILNLPHTSWMRALCRSILRAFMILTMAACKYILRSSSTALLVCSISWSERGRRLLLEAPLEGQRGFEVLGVSPAACLSASTWWSWISSSCWWNSYLVKTWTLSRSPPEAQQEDDNERQKQSNNEASFESCLLPDGPKYSRLFLLHQKQRWAEDQQVRAFYWHWNTNVKFKTLHPPVDKLWPSFIVMWNNTVLCNIRTHEADT